MLVLGGWREEGGIGSLLRTCWVTVVVPGVSLGLFRQAQRAHQAKPGSNTTPAPTLHKREKNKSREAPLKKATPGGYMLVRGGWRGEGGIGSLLRACWVTVVVAGVSLGLSIRQREEIKQRGSATTAERRCANISDKSTARTDRRKGG